MSEHVDICIFISLVPQAPMCYNYSTLKSILHLLFYFQAFQPVASII